MQTETNPATSSLLGSSKTKKYKVKLFYDWEQINECGSAAFFTTPLVNFPSKLISGGSYDLRRKCFTDSMYKTPWNWSLWWGWASHILNLQIQKAIQKVENWTSFGAHSRADVPFESGASRPSGIVWRCRFIDMLNYYGPAYCSKV